jgi:hypothetical protein
LVRWAKLLSMWCRPTKWPVGGFIFCRDGEGCRCEIGVRMLQFLSIQVGEKRAKHIWHPTKHVKHWFTRCNGEYTFFNFGPNLRKWMGQTLCGNHWLLEVPRVTGRIPAKSPSKDVSILIPMIPIESWFDGYILLPSG